MRKRERTAGEDVFGGVFESDSEGVEAAGAEESEVRSRAGTVDED